MKALSQIDTDDMTYEELTQQFEAVKSLSVDCKCRVFALEKKTSVYEKNTHRRPTLTPTELPFVLRKQSPSICTILNPIIIIVSTGHQ